MVLVALQTFADYRDGTGAHPGVETLAVLCAVDERTARRALEAGSRLGLIEMTARANPKAHKAAVWRLISTGHQCPPETASSGHASPVETQFNRTNQPFLPDKNRVSTGHPRPPTFPTFPKHQGSDLKSEQDEPLTVDHENHPPPQQQANGKRPRCPRHAHIEDDDAVPRCLDCRDARLAQEAEKSARDDQQSAEKTRIRRLIDHCDDCDQYGRLWDDVDTDCPAHPNFLKRKQVSA